MLQSKSQKFVVVLVTLILLGALGYFVFNNSEIPATPADLAEGEVLGQDILVLAEKVNTISLDKAVFDSIVFQSLVDLGIPLFPEAQGRNNPFALIGVEGGSTKPTTQPR